MGLPKKHKRLILLDTHAILHRAYHALPDFSSSKGEPTGALYGLVSMLLKLVSDLEPDYLVATFDLPKPTHRHEAFDGYKGTRTKTDDALVLQIERSRDVLAAFGVPIYEAAGFEADDVLGTIVSMCAKKKDLEIIIASGDMDTLQLIDGERVRVFTLKKGINDTILYDEAAVHARFGFGPEHIPDYKGFRGDPSDNIPGVKGIGEKMATALITSFGSLDDIYKALSKDTVAAAKKAGLSPRITQLLIDQEEEARFSKMLAEIRTDAPVPFVLPEETFRKSLNIERLASLLSELEFRSLIPRAKSVLGGEMGAFQKEEEAPKEEVPAPEAVAPIALALWVLDSTVSAPDLDDIYRYAKTRVFTEAKEVILKALRKEPGLSFVYEHIELPVMPILRRMEEQGILVDTKELGRLSKEYHTELDRIASRIYKAAGKEFNINSPRQLGEVLFETLGLGVKNQKKTSTGQKSTKESELEKLKDAHPIVSDILSHRELQKLLSTYIDTIPTLLDQNNRLHTTFVQTGTTTGRLSSREPNLQNIPVKTELGKAIRNAFVTPKGYTLAAFDYSQIELRIAALLSEDEKLISIFKEGGDVHAAVASRVFGVPQDAVTSDMRRQAKVINFGILYGMGVTALKDNLGSTRKEAQEFYDQYFATFTGLASYLDDVKAQAAKVGYTETLFGRRRYFEGIRSPIPFVRAAAERMALNAPIQGTQADVVKLAMVSIEDMLKKEGLNDTARLLLQVHDELIYEIKEEALQTLVPRIRAHMEGMLSEGQRKGIPFIAKASVGRSWGELHEYAQ